MKKMLMPFIKKENKMLLFVSILIGLSTIAVLGLPLILQHYIDHITSNNATLRNLYYLAAIYLLGSIFLFVLQRMRLSNSEWVSWKICDNLRVESVRRILNYNQEFFNHFSTGEIVEGIGKDIDKLEQYIKSTLLPILVNVLNILGIVIVLWVKNWILGLFILGFVIISFILLFNEVNKNSEVIQGERIHTNEINGLFGEIIDNRVVLNVFARIREIFSKIDDKYSILKHFRIRRQIFLYRIWVITLILFAVVNILSLFIGGEFYFKNLLSMGTIYLLYKYIELLKNPMEQFQTYVQNTLDLKGALAHLSKLINFIEQISHGNKEIVGSHIHIAVKGLDFAYEDENILHNIHLSFEAGKKTGIFGDSGSGKSTLCKIITKQLGIQDGKVFINGMDINQISVSGVRERIGYISAEASVFNGNIMDNLLMYDESLTEEIVKATLEKGLLNFFQSFSGKSWENILELDLNKSFSAGEKQLFTLVRLFFRPKALYVFDEALSIVEEEIEDYFYDMLDKLTHNAGIIYVTHNVERLKMCDFIVVIKNGNVIEQGAAKELLADEDSLFKRYLKREWRTLNE